MNDIIKIVKYLEECGLLIKDKICKVIEKIKNEETNKKEGFLECYLPLQVFVYQEIQ